MGKIDYIKCPSCGMVINYDDALHQKCSYCGNENLMAEKADGSKVPCSVWLEGQTLKNLKRHQEMCSQMSKMKYAILEAVEYLDSNKLNQIGAESIIHKNLRDAVAD